MKQHVVSAGRGNLQGAFDVFLALDFGEVQVVVRRLLENLAMSTLIGAILISPRGNPRPRAGFERE